MKVALFGASGFLGYDFVRFALRAGGVKLVAYASSPNNLANISRHGVDIRLYSGEDSSTQTVDLGTDVVVSFAHPFEQRDGISGMEQIKRFVRAIGRAKLVNPSLRLIYLSSMSVFEPFEQNRRFSEVDPLHPPLDDRYAQEKLFAETALRELPKADQWQLHLRPTIVYGPFCRPFTDRIFDVFKRGDVGYRNLSGCIQPIYGEDVSRFIYGRLTDFKPGTYNVAGPEEMSWYDFIDVFREIAGHGRLVELSPTECDGDSTNANSWKSDLKQLVNAVRREPPFERMVSRIVRRLPAALHGRMRASLLADRIEADRSPAIGPPRDTAIFGRSFFARDRLVCDKKCRRDYPTIELRRVSDVKSVLEDYYRFRFSDLRFV